ncbi:MAG: hypothetical protein M3032_11475 [Verrucomicrobiota bacterium]|nr:hypothetical protein [Verrucomicrobiota bacterium]
MAGGGGLLQLEREGADLGFELQQERLGMAEHRLHPRRHVEPGKGARFPPFLHRLEAVIDQETAAVGFELFAGPDQLLALPMKGAGLFFGFGWARTKASASVFPST